MAKSKRTILIVDDHQDTCVLIRHMLNAEDYTILTANSAAEATGILRIREKIDLVLSDIQMPVTSGLQLAGAIKQEFPDMPVILMSGHAQLADPAVQALKLSGFLRKPFRAANLIAGLRAAFGETAKVATPPRTSRSS